MNQIKKLVTSKDIEECCKDAFGIEVGDVVTCNNEIFVVSKENDTYYLENENGEEFLLEYLIDHEYYVFHKTIGDLTCSDVDCAKCPLKVLCKAYLNKENVELDHLYTPLNDHFDKFMKDAKQDGWYDFMLFNIVKARLSVDKELLDEK